MIAQALQSLRPKAQWSLSGPTYADLVWHDEEQTQPSEQEVLDEVARLETEFVNNEYQRVRKTQYPSLGDQLDMLWHAIDNGTLNKTSDFYTTIKAVKDANPKSE